MVFSVELSQTGPLNNPLFFLTIWRNRVFSIWAISIECSAFHVVVYCATGTMEITFTASIVVIFPTAGMCGGRRFQCWLNLFIT